MFVDEDPGFRRVGHIVILAEDTPFAAAIAENNAFLRRVGPVASRCGSVGPCADRLRSGDAAEGANPPYIGTLGRGPVPGTLVYAGSLRIRNENGGALVEEGLWIPIRRVVAHEI